MRLKKLGIIATALLATASFAEIAQQAPPEPPAPPQVEAPRVEKHKVRVYVQANGSYLGVDPRDVTPDRMGALKLSEPRGVEVMMVDRDAPAGKAGVKEHDVIVGFDSKPVANAEQLRRMLRETTPGKTVPLQVDRNGQRMTLNVALTKRPEEFAGMPPMPPMAPIDIDVPNIIVLQSSSRNGVMVEDLTPQLAEFFGVRGGGGVLVRAVDRGSAADTAGLKAGDVIVKVANEPISCSSDWRKNMRGRHGSVPLGVVRDKREQSLTIKLPEKSPESSLQFDMPDLKAEIEQMQAELEKQRPEFEKQVRIAQAQAAKELKAHQKEMQDAMTKWRDQDFKKEMEKAQQELKKALDEMTRELNKE